MAYIRPLIPTLPLASLTGLISTVPVTVPSAGVAFAYHPYLERIANSLENLSECTYIFAGIFAPVQPISQLASVTGTVTGSVVSGLDPSAVAKMLPGMVLTNLAVAPAPNTGYFGGLTKIATINSTTSITISSQFPNNDGPITFMAGGYGTLTCTPTVPSLQADPRPGMLLVGPGILPGTFIVDYVVPGVSAEFYVSMPQKSDPSNPIYLMAAVGPLAAAGQALTNIEANISALTNMANNQGIHAVDPYSIIEKATQYAYYAQNPSALDQLISELATLPPELASIKNILKGVTKNP